MARAARVELGLVRNLTAAGPFDYIATVADRRFDVLLPSLRSGGGIWTFEKRWRNETSTARIYPGRNPSNGRFTHVDVGF